MTTEYISMTEEELDREGLSRAGRILRGGGLVAFPTETVYGLGGDALNPDSSRKIYAAKGRPSDNPLIVHICRLEDLKAIADPVPEEAYALAERFWPGPLTMIFHKKDAVPAATTGGLDTVAVRFPSNKIAQALIDEAGGFVAAPSANRSGRPSPTLARYCREDLDGNVEMIIDGGPVGIGVESTIIDLTGDEPTILRPGYITQEDLKRVLGEVAVDRAIIAPDSGIRPKAPGMKYRHYAPKGDLTVIEGAPDHVRSRISELLAAAEAAGKKTGVICTKESEDFYRADSVKSTGERGDEEAAAREIFRILREFDEEGAEVLFSESFADGSFSGDAEEGIGQAILNRLIKAAGHRVIKVQQETTTGETGGRK